jgi:hypothetical protein
VASPAAAAVAITAVVAVAASAAVVALAATAAVAIIAETAAVAITAATVAASTASTAIVAVAASTAVAAAAPAMVAAAVGLAWLVAGLSWLDCCWLSIDGGWRIWRTQFSCCLSSGRPPSYRDRGKENFREKKSGALMPIRILNQVLYIWETRNLFCLLFTSLYCSSFLFSVRGLIIFSFFWQDFVIFWEKVWFSFTLGGNSYRSGSAKMMPILPDLYPQQLKKDLVTLHNVLKLTVLFLTGDAVLLGNS